MFVLKYLFGKKPQIPTNKFNFKVQYSFDKRYEESSKMIKKHPGKIPIIVEKAENSEVEEIDKNKWLIDGNLTIGQFLILIRRKIKIDPGKNIYIFVNNDFIPATSDKLNDIYNKHKDTDLFLYMTYSKEVSFGY